MSESGSPVSQTAAAAPAAPAATAGAATAGVARSAGLVGIATMASRLLGLLRDWVFLTAFGAGHVHGRLQRGVPAAQPGAGPVRRGRDERRLRPDLHPRAAQQGEGRGLGARPHRHHRPHRRHRRHHRRRHPPGRPDHRLRRARVRGDARQARAHHHADAGDVPVPHADRGRGRVHGHAELAAVVSSCRRSRRRCSTSPASPAPS